MIRTPSPSPRAASWLEPFASAIWPLFLVVTALVALVWTMGFGEAESAAWVRVHFGGSDPRETGVASPLAESLTLALGLMDPFWIVLAAAVTYASLVAEVGLANARRWFLIAFAAAFLVAAISRLTSWPLGPIRYTDRLGPRAARVPLGWPLLWCIVVFGSREFLRWAAPRSSHWQVALGTGFLALLTDLNLEPVAWKVRVYWLWYPEQLPAPPSAPLQGAITWLVLASALAYLFRAPTVARNRSAPHPARLCAPLLLLNALLLLARIPGR